MNVEITITANDGVQVKNTEGAVGSYIGVDAPHYLQGECNVFIGKSFTAAKGAAKEFLKELRERIEEDMDALDYLRVKDAR